jgi:hypothetical protein
MATAPDKTPQQYLDAIQATYPDLDRWRERAREHEAPQRASELAIDDKVFPQFRVSEVARLSLMSAGEHLRLVRDGLTARNVYPSASHTTLRGALVGAAQAVWVLAPDDAETRQQRALTVVHVTYKQLRTYDNDVNKMQWLSRDDRAELEDHLKWLNERIGQVESLRRSKSDLDITGGVLPEALRAAFNDQRMTDSGLMMWRQMSGDAHVLSWSLAQRTTFSGRPDAEGLSLGEAAGDLGEVADAFYLGYRLLKVGWGLFDRRCETTT